MAFPSSPSNGQIVTRFGRKYQYNQDTGQWRGVQAVATTTIADIVDEAYIAARVSGLGGGAPTTYADAAAFPSSGNSVGDFAVALDTKALYMWDGSEWDRIKVGVEEGPVFTVEPDARYLTTKGADPFIITAAAIDPEGFAVSYDYGTSPSNQTNATITNNNDGTFTVTPSLTDDGSFALRLLANDGVNISTRTSVISVSAYYADYLLDGSFNVLRNTTGSTITVINNGISTVDTDKSQIAQDGDYISIQDLPDMTLAREPGKYFPVFAVRFDSANAGAGIGITLRNSVGAYQYSIVQNTTTWGSMSNGSSTYYPFSPALSSSQWYIFSPIGHYSAGLNCWRVKPVGGSAIDVSYGSGVGYATPTTTLDGSISFFGNNPNLSGIGGYLSRAVMPHSFGGMGLYPVNSIPVDDAITEIESTLFS